jgi:hypothetical protein
MKTDEMRTSYKREDLGTGVRGKYYEVAQVFQTEEAVNEALLSLIKLAQNSVNLKS